MSEFIAISSEVGARLGDNGKPIFCRLSSGEIIDRERALKAFCDEYHVTRRQAYQTIMTQLLFPPRFDQKQKRKEMKWS